MLIQVTEWLTCTQLETRPVRAKWRQSLLDCRWRVAAADFCPSSHNSELLYGQSITEACVDFATTERMLAQLADDVARQSPTRASA